MGERSFFTGLQRGIQQGIPIGVQSFERRRAERLRGGTPEERARVQALRERQLTLQERGLGLQERQQDIDLAAAQRARDTQAQLRAIQRGESVAEAAVAAPPPQAPAQMQARQQLLQGVTGFNTIMSQPPGPARSFALEQAGKALNLPENFIAQAKKANPEQSRELRQVVAGLARTVPDAQRFGQILNSPEQLLSFVTEIGNRQTLGEVAGRTPGAPAPGAPAAVPPRVPPGVGPPRAPGVRPITAAGVAAPIPARAAAARAVMPPTVSPEAEAEAATRAAPGGQAAGPVARTVARQPTPQQQQQALFARQQALQARLNQLTRLDVTVPGVDQAIDNTRRELEDARRGFRGLSNQQRQQGNSLRREFRGLSKTFRDVTDAFGRVEASSRNPSAAGDLSMIFAFMKILDPGSAVLAGEQATAQNAAGVPDIVRNIWNRLLTGTRLGPDQRQDFLTRARILYSDAIRSHEGLTQQYRALAERQGIDPENVIVEFGRTPTSARPTPSPAGRRPQTARPTPGRTAGAGRAQPPQPFVPSAGAMQDIDRILAQP